MKGIPRLENWMGGEFKGGESTEIKNAKIE